MIKFDLIAWDGPEDEDGNVRHIARNDVTTEEVEEILESPDGRDGISRSSRRPIRSGQTSTGRPIVVVYEIEREGDYVVIWPVTAYEPE